MTVDESEFGLGDEVRVEVVGTINAVGSGPKEPGKQRVIMVHIPDGDTVFDIHGGWPSGRSIVLPPENLTLLKRRNWKTGKLEDV